MKKFINEFKEFAIRGNVIDLAIGVVIGGAFTAIVNSLVTDIITPFISLIANTSNLETLEYVLREAVVAADGTIITEAVIFRYGSFIDAIISFFIIALVIFMLIKTINKLNRKQEVEEEEEVEVAPELSDEAILLQKIYETLQSKEN
ncbi:MAG: large conductance mechanosensitive channel protein MscL [Erysipelothrix sp.]|nr:large conductance mechanosensitive channel protein MscL [Erysipelothrix sp.]